MWYDIQLGEHKAKYKIMTVDSDKSVKCDKEGREIKRTTIQKAVMQNQYKDTKEAYKGKEYYKREGEIYDSKPVFPRTTAIKSNEMEELPVGFHNDLMTEKYLYFDSAEIREQLERYTLEFGFTMVLRESETSYLCILTLRDGHLIGYLGRGFMVEAIDSIVENRPLKATDKAKTYLKPESILKKSFKQVIKKDTKKGVEKPAIVTQQTDKQKER